MSAETDDGRFANRSPVEVLREWYRIFALLLITLFVFWTRFQNYQTFIRDAEGLWLQSVELWYHWRTINWTVENFQWVIGLDPWTGFPEGSFTGQFGTLYDQIIATVALIIGGSSPTQQQVLLAALFTISVIAALVAVPTYYIGKRIGGRVGAVAGIAFLALAPE